MATIDDVARACGMAKSTVSRVINNSERNVSAKTRERVMKVVREMKYQPSAMAQGLSTQRSNMIGIVTKRMSHILTDVYYSTVIDSIVEAAADRKKAVALYSGRIWQDEDCTRVVFADGRCDGLILLMAEHDAPLTGALQAKKIPFVYVNSGVRVEGVSSVDIDNVDAGYRMTNYLIKHGHRRIACLHTGIDPFSMDRLEGYKLALAKAGIPYDDRLNVVGFYTTDNNGYLRAQELLDNIELGITGIFAATDSLAVDAIQGIKDLGYRVPDDVSVVGINNTYDAVRCNPPLTTLSQSVESIGSESVALLLDMIQDSEIPARNVVWPTEIIVRESVVQYVPRAKSRHAHVIRMKEVTV